MSEEQFICLIEKLLKQKNKQAVVIITGALAYQSEMIEILNNYKQVSFQLIFSEAAKKMVDLKKWQELGTELETLESIRKAISKTECVILPSLTRNTLAKSAMGVADTMSLIAIQWTLMSGKPLIAVDECWNPESNQAKLAGWDQNQAYNKLLYSYQERLTDLGMISIKITEFHQYMKAYFNESVLPIVVEKETKESSEKPTAPVKKIITHRDVLSKKKVYATADFYLTDLAKEYVETNQVEIIVDKVN